MHDETVKANDEDYQISNYRTDRGIEVDFIFEMNGDTFAIEVKATKNRSAPFYCGFTAA